MLQQLKMIKGCLECAVAEQVADLKNADVHELGQAVDMIKDIAEAMYYCTKAEKKHQEKVEENYIEYSGNYHSTSDTMSHKDMKEGRSPLHRRTYIESKEHGDKTTAMQKLELYAQDLVTDVLEMLQDSSPEEKMLLHKKLVALSEKVKTL